MADFGCDTYIFHIRSGTRTDTSTISDLATQLSDVVLFLAGLTEETAPK